MGCGASKAALHQVEKSDHTCITSTRHTSNHSVVVINMRTNAASQHRTPQQDRLWKNELGLLVVDQSSSSEFCSLDSDESSRNSKCLDLETLRKEIVSDGDVLTSIVRFESASGRPIEEIYNGVHDGVVLGKGATGIVRKVTHRATGVEYAAKCLDLSRIHSEEQLYRLRTEISIMCLLDHPNIVRIKEVYETSTTLYILMELCEGGDLWQHLDRQSNYHYTEAACARLVKQMLSAVRYLHSKGIVHCDLKLENFLFMNSSDAELKMTDFGLSMYFQPGQPLYHKVGTPYTIAPEMLLGGYDEKCDVWAVGVITYLLLSGATPFGGLDGEDLMWVKENIIRGQVSYRPPDIWDMVGDDGKAFVKQLLNRSLQKRPTAEAAYLSGWVQAWANEDIVKPKQLRSETVMILLAFKERPYIQKLLSKAVSFTLLPEQVRNLQQEFEVLDADGDGEISLSEFRAVFSEASEVSSPLTDQEIEDLFYSIGRRGSDSKIRWHEFLAAVLPLAQVDQRNLGLAFERLDSDRKGFIAYDDLLNIFDIAPGNETMESLWIEQCCDDADRITYDEFTRLMKGEQRKQVRFMVN